MLPIGSQEAIRARISSSSGMYGSFLTEISTVYKSAWKVMRRSLSTGAKTRPVLSFGI